MHLKVAFRRLFRCKGKKEEADPPEMLPKLYSLPVEIFLYVVDQLPPPDTAALSLTSKTLLNIVGHQTLRLENIYDRRELLRRFEAHYPQHLLCHQCGIFHRRPRRTRKAMLTHHRSNNETVYCDRKNGTFRNFHHSLQIPFSLVQEVMNRHRYGRKHGLRPNVLNFLEPFLQTEPFETTAKIIQGELSLSVDERACVSSSAFNFETTVKSKYRKYCPHFSTSNIDQFPARPMEKSTEQQSSQRLFFRCLECKTVVYLEYVTSSPAMRMSHLRTTAWYNLGRCSDPFDPQWLAVTGEAKLYPPTYPRMEYLPPSEIAYTNSLSLPKWNVLRK